ncbi:hypothetical protein AAU61_13225 [Desulfocarbo indianensis]|nr:hypothetical protein AAU61_13225 [Desulfocarbo indianensis]
MGADRARITYDPSRRYREVIRQQGRVTLEADVNEAERIGSEGVRTHALDFVGPWGTPDDGYRVKPLASGDFEAGSGTMYVSGLRVTSDSAIRYISQDDWLNAKVDPLWVDPKEALKVDAAVFLLCQEQEICAVEDPALREVALGGPDSAARTRLLQRLLLAPCKGPTCQAAISALINYWTKRGIEFDPLTGQLLSQARLQVTQVTTDPVSEPCDPPAQSGYLVADNQLIKVQIVSYDPQSQEGVLIWGFNNASILYRCQALDGHTLRLETKPISPEHAPHTGQAVQVLPAAAVLGEDAFAASLNGLVEILTEPYQADTNTITLPEALPERYLGMSDKAPLFLRLWERQVIFRLNQPVELLGTGLAVTIGLADGENISPGDYWCFAGRPLTPYAVYPQRIMDAPQPPEGPRRWGCPLAVLKPLQREFQVAEDCREPFDNLVELTARESGSCCCITLDPKKAESLQSVLDKVTQEKVPMKMVIRLEPGRYLLNEPLRLGKKHRGLVMESCTGGDVVFSIKGGAEKNFSYGMFLLDDAVDMTFKGLSWLVQESPWPEIPDTHKKYKQLLQRRLKVSIDKTAVALHVSDAKNIKLEDCSFMFRTGQNAFGAGLLGRGVLQDIKIRGCNWRQMQLKEESHIAGALVAPLLGPEGKGLKVLPELDGLDISGCSFDLLSAGVFLVAQIEAAAVRDNSSQGCHTALLIMELPETTPELTELDVTHADEAAPPDPGQAAKFLAAMRKDRWLATLLGFAPLLWPETAVSGPNPRIIERDPGTIRDERIRLLRSRNRGLARIVRDHVIPSNISISEEVQVETAVMKLLISGNEFDCRPAMASKKESGPAVFIWDMLNQGPSTANLTGNSFWNQSSLAPTLFVQMIKGFNITGNNLVNTVKETGSGPEGLPGQSRMALIVTPGGRVTPLHIKEEVNLFTVTGNTMFGSSNLYQWIRKEWADKLPKEMKALLTWDFFNTQT